MGTPSLDEVLHRVAAGELTPEEALALMEPAQGSSPSGSPSATTAATTAALTTPTTTDATATPGTTSTPAGADPLTLHEPSGNARPVADAPPAWGTPAASPSTPGRAANPTGRPSAAIRIHASYRSVDVLADPGVAEAVVSGTHSARRDRDTLVIESMDSPFGDTTEDRAGSGPRFSFDLPRSLAWARSWKEHHLVVRVNPDLPVEIDGAGASVRLSGLEGGARVRLIASALKLERVRGPLDVDAMSSSVKGFASPTGTSRIVAESSSVKLLLGPESDVHVRARNRMGKVVLPQAVSKGGLVDPDVAEARFGSGRGELTIDAVMSSVMLAGDAASARDWQ